MIRKADVSWSSPFEQDLLNQLTPESRIMILSTIHEPLAETKSFAERDGLVFIGGFRHPPNVDAVLWYAIEISRGFANGPGVKTYIIGGDTPSTIRTGGGGSDRDRPST